jgi:sulfite reductase alpha subunit-like flavoprotein
LSFCHFGTLNSASPNLFCEGDTILVVASTTGQGQTPSNGLRFAEKIKSLREKPISSLKYSVFGIGDSGYHLTFNAAANTISRNLLDIGASPIGSLGVFASDVALENPPLSKFQLWWNNIDQQIDRSLDVSGMAQFEKDRLLQEFESLNSYKEGTLYFNHGEHQAGRVMKLSIAMGSTYEEMSHIRVLPRNSLDGVERVLFLLDVLDGDAKLNLHDGQSNKTDKDPTIREFLTHYVDLNRSFNSLNWIKTQYPGVELFADNKSVLEFLHDIFVAGVKPPTLKSLDQILLSMPIQRPRCYSIASSPVYSNIDESKTVSADMLIRVIPGGRFSSQCLSDIQSGDKIRYKLDSFNLTMPLLDLTDKPLVAVTCGTGFGPMRSLIQRRAQEAKSAMSSPKLMPSDALKEAPGKITLYLGFKPQDKAIFVSTVSEASKYDIFDAIHMVPSNEEKIRVQDLFEDSRDRLVEKLVVQDGWFYVCGNREMVGGVEERMRDVLGPDIWERINERVVQEVF